MGISVGVFVNYAKNPFVVIELCDGHGQLQHVQPDDHDNLRRDGPGHVRCAGLGVPDPAAGAWAARAGFVCVRARSRQCYGLPASGGFHAAGVGDPMVEGKYRFPRQPPRPVPAGRWARHERSGRTGLQQPEQGKYYYLGNSSPVVGLRAIFDGATGSFQYGLNLRGQFRDKATVSTTSVGPAAFQYGVGGGYRLSPTFRVIAEGFGSTQFSSDRATNTMELDGAVEFNVFSSHLLIRAGGGAGVLEGIGVPNAGHSWGSRMLTRSATCDGDGIPDDVDKCPTLPEDKDGFEDEDGCPDLDNDGDKIPDDERQVPERARDLQRLHGRRWLPGRAPRP